MRSFLSPFQFRFNLAQRLRGENICNDMELFKYDMWKIENALMGVICTAVRVPSCK